MYVQWCGLVKHYLKPRPSREAPPRKVEVLFFMKKCTECGIVKNLTEFHKNPKAYDGVRTKCKKCICNRQSTYRKNNHEKITAYSRNWLEKNPEYGKMYYLKKYVKKNKIALTEDELKQRKKNHDLNYKEKYPEKHKAKMAVNFVKVEKGIHKHHWSYNKTDYKNVILLEAKTHLTLHKYLKYCNKTFYYKSINGELLDTKEKHLAYIQQLLKNNKL